MLGVLSRREPVATQAAARLLRASDGSRLDASAAEDVDVTSDDPSAPSCAAALNSSGGADAEPTRAYAASAPPEGSCWRQTAFLSWRSSSASAKFRVARLASLIALLVFATAAALTRGGFDWRPGSRGLQRPANAGDDGPPRLTSAAQALPELDAETLRSSYPLCNRSTTWKASKRSVFQLPEPWLKACANIEHTPETLAYPFRNWCWAWMKYKGCYGKASSGHGHWTWREAQAAAAADGLAPPPEELEFQPVQNPSLCENRVFGQSLTFDASQGARALQWMRENVQVYVLNLPSDTERWTRISSRLAQLGLFSTRISGIDLAQLGAFEAAKEKGLIPQDFDYEEAARHAAVHMGGILGTVGVAAAHLNAMHLAQLQRPWKPLALIFEDDVYPEDDFVVRLHRLLEGEVPCDWQVLSLKSRCPYGECVTPHLTRVMPDINEPEDRCRHGVNYGFYAMLYRAETLSALRNRLSEAVWRADRPRCLDIDVALASISDEVAYYAVPSVQSPGFLLEGHDGSSRFMHNLVGVPLGSSEVALECGGAGRYLVVAIDGNILASEPQRPSAMPTPWEQFEMERFQNGKVALRSHSRKYLSARPDGSIKADQSAISNWELFELVTHKDGQVSFKSFHGTYLSAPAGGMVRLVPLAAGDEEAQRFRLT